MKHYTCAPLTFMGQKRNFVREFRKVLSGYTDNVTIVDLFGGSGLLSEVSKEEKPNARVVFNDYDNFRKRIENIPRTNKLLGDIRDILLNTQRHVRIDKKTKELIIQKVMQEDGFIDFITISSSLLFSSKYATNLEEFTKETLYNKVIQRDYDATGYLTDVEIVCSDYKDVFNEYKDCENVLFLLDPPYLCTQCNTYRMSWGLGDYLDVLTILDGHSYVYFTSNKNNIFELCDWIGRHRIDKDPFCGAKRAEVLQHLNYDSRYMDIMLYKKA